MNKNIIIFGNSDFAKLMYFYFKTDEKYNIAGFCVDDEYIKEKTFCDLQVIPFSRIIEYPKEKYSFFIAIGYQKINTVREQIYNKLKSMGYSCISYIHKSAVVSATTEIKENCVILENAVIQPFCKIGENTIILPGSIICHDAEIGSHCFIASGVCVNGYTKVKDNTFLGAGSIIRDKITIGSKNLIGAGCCILHSTDDNYACKSARENPINVLSEKIRI